MQQLRGNLANFAATMASLRSVAAAAPSQCARATRPAELALLLFRGLWLPIKFRCCMHVKLSVHSSSQCTEEAHTSRPFCLGIMCCSAVH